MVQTITIEEVASKLDLKSAYEVSCNHYSLEETFGMDQLVDVYIDAFPSIQHVSGGFTIVATITGYAKVDPNVVKLACFALTDRSKWVRHYACQALAFSLSHESLKCLEKILNHTNFETRDDAKAALNAIRKNNHHLFVDREESGKVFWNPRII